MNTEWTNVDNRDGSVLACWGRAALDALRAQGIAPCARHASLGVELRDALLSALVRMLRARVNESAVRAYLSSRMKPALTTRLREAIAERLSTIVSPQLVATELGLSLRSLQRGLKAHETSYEELLREVRLELACGQLRERRRTSSEIAFSLGYDNASAFSRAFRRWTGMAPSEYVRRTQP
jgi:AraC-like DNA-binding protein